MLRATTFLQREAEYVPWAIALNNLDYVHSMFVRSPEYGLLEVNKGVLFQRVATPRLNQTELSCQIALKVTKILDYCSIITSRITLQNSLRCPPPPSQLQKYLLHLLEPLYESVGFADDHRDPHLDQYKRVKATFWACRKLLHSDCVTSSVQLFQHWMTNPNNNR